jgi:hypothetical protein
MEELRIGSGGKHIVSAGGNPAGSFFSTEAFFPFSVTASQWPGLRQMPQPLHCSSLTLATTHLKNGFFSFFSEIIFFLLTFEKMYVNSMPRKSENP